MTAGMGVRRILLGTILVLILVTQPSTLAAAERGHSADASALAADEAATPATVGTAGVEALSPATELKMLDRSPVLSTNDQWSGFPCPPPAEASACVYGALASFGTPALEAGRRLRAALTPLVLTPTPRGVADDVIRGPGPRGGESTAAARGRQAHQSWDYGPGFRSEFRLPSGRRVDGINFQTRQVVELKPNNPRDIREGQRQLDRYLDELNREFPGAPWTGRVETYNP